MVIVEAQPPLVVLPRPIAEPKVAPLVASNGLCCSDTNICDCLNARVACTCDCPGCICSG